MKYKVSDMNLGEKLKKEEWAWQQSYSVETYFVWWWAASEWQAMKEGATKDLLQRRGGNANDEGDTSYLSRIVGMD